MRNIPSSPCNADSEEMARWGEHHHGSCTSEVAIAMTTGQGRRGGVLCCWHHVTEKMGIMYGRNHDAECVLKKGDA